MKVLRIASRISAIYLLIGFTWILLSDWITFSDANVKEAYWFATAKGLAYVFTTAVLLYWLISRNSRMLSESEERFRLLVESAPDAVLVQSGGRIAYMNAAALRMIGASSADQVVGHYVIDFVHPTSRDVVKGRIVSVTDGKSPVTCQEETYMRLDGSPIICEVSAVPIRFNGVDSALVFIRDATERKMAQAQQAHVQKVEMIRQLAAKLAHEFNNLVQVINGNADLARSSLPAGAPEQKCLDQVLFAGRQVADWVAKIMALSTSQNPTVTDLALTMKDIVPPMPASVTLAAPARAPACPVAVPAESRGVKPVAAGGEMGKATILFAEDDDMVRNLTERFLRNAGYSVLLAKDGAEAVALFEDNASRISMVLLDVVMPRMGGFDAYQRISARDATMPVIFASGFSGYETPANLELVAGVNFLQKPYDRKDLIEAIRRAVEPRSAAAYG